MTLAAISAANGERVSPMWLVVFYLFATFGELCLSRLFERHVQTGAGAGGGVDDGGLVPASSVGNKIAGRMGGLYESLSVPMIFTISAAFPLVFALILAALVRPIRRMLAKTA